MAANTVWAIDVGHTALRAVKARRLGDRVQVLSFDLVEYRQSLVSPGADRDVQIQQAVHTFVSRNDLRRCAVAVVMPAPSALVRFIQLPPVDRGAVADIVQYEARQQIPFPLEEVCWDHAAIDRGFIPGEQVEVGIFALRRELALAFLSCLRVGGLDPDLLQIPQVSLLNFVTFDRSPGRDAILVMDMGVENTHLLCLSEDTVWTRSLPLGGNAFTQAIQKALALSYEESEQEKLNARKSARAKEIADAVSAPVSRFVEEVQRSLGYFRSLHPETRVSSVLALGGGFRLPGLVRYVQEASGLEIHGLTALENYDLTQARNVNRFKEHAASFPLALGLAAQVLGITGTLDTTMLPTEVVRTKVLARKKPYAAAAVACILALVGVLLAGEELRNVRLRGMEKGVLKDATNEVKTVQDLQNRAKAVSWQDELEALGKVRSVFETRWLWPRVLEELVKPIPPEPQNTTIWLTAISSSYVSAQDAAQTLVTIPAALGGPGGERRPFGPAGLMQGQGPPMGMGGPMVSAVMPDQVLSVLVLGEAKHADRALFIDREYVSKLNSSGLLSFARLRFSSPPGTAYRWVDGTGQIVAAATAPGGVGGRPEAPVGVPGGAEGGPPADWKRVEVTQFRVQAFVDTEGKLAKAVGELQKLFSAPASPQAPQR
jgi:type IV pilus assembly protein PilM